MSAAEKKRVKEALAAYLADPETPGELSPGEVAKVIERRTGLDFGATTIAKYMKGEGWIRDEAGGGAVRYRRTA